MRSAHSSRPLCLAALLLSGCVVFAGPDDRGPVRDLVAARARWNLHGNADYDVTARALCFCVHGGREVRVTVRRGQVTGATFVATGLPVEPAFLSTYRTVEQLFDLIEDAVERRAHRIDATYDPARGYPSRFWIDYSEMVADEEFGYEIVTFTPR